MLTFNETKRDAEHYLENARLTHYHTPSQLIKYYANYYEYKVMPTVEQFKEDIAAQQNFHLERGQQHLLFLFPENMELSDQLLALSRDYGFTLNKMELYKADTSQLTASCNPRVQIVEVLERGKAFNDFLVVCRESEIEYGEEFVELKRTTHTRDLMDPSVIQLIAYMDGEPAGKLEAILNKQTVELDDFYVRKVFQGRGIGSQLQHFVWERAGQRSVILIADGDDTARDMYQKQGYRKISERYELLKTE
ncbi:GNAT family N-acetyltransferase [Macrococcus equipercicus]|uniref:GNAT family N-acetyltransferase n=1 Tax=Macrococcus equipercicus TaxID=69967 RepID=A0ABQ6R924_9STAP|nr:GNAT family N-acetyltransferase [Macrococcus equipercicus]KAA1039625.1 GNAT family N-acetyltransferase [Macrococcus equipercicus]